MSKPKRSRSSFSLFFEDVRIDVLAENPGLPFDKMVTEIGKRWHALSDDEQKTYIDKADDDRERYAIEMEAYVEPTTKKAKKDAEKDDMKPKKALSAYLIFINENRDAMKKDHPEETMTGLSKLLAERWNGMGAEDKVEWNEKAEADKVRYSNELNEYNLHKSMLELKKPPPKIEEEPAEPETGDTAPAEEAEEKTES
mmetsp:Transcript_11236/g.14594  ORF Transcript_11236/g.14594 Transcript_11236/m.14594 type:complete len:198 (+) Transcript_11236:52-645(+)